MNLKTWQKFFVCTFAVVFVSLYFILDVLFFNPSPQNNMNQSVISGEEFIETPQVETPESNNKTQEDNSSTEEVTIPKYTNGWSCLNDAITRTFNSKYAVFSFISLGESVGQKQKIKGINYHLDKQYISQTFAYSESSFGTSFYERIISDEKGENYTVIKTRNINSSYEYNIEGVEEKIYTYDEFHQTHKGRKILFSCIPTNQNSKLTGFDSRQNEKYYIINIMFKADSIPEEYIEVVKSNAGASNISHKYFEMEFYVSKKTGKIEKITQNEQYKLTKGVTIDVQYTLSGSITYYPQKIEVKF